MQKMRLEVVETLPLKNNPKLPQQKQHAIFNMVLKKEGKKQIVIIYESFFFFPIFLRSKTVWPGAHIAVLRSRLPAARLPAGPVAPWPSSGFLHESLT